MLLCSVAGSVFMMLQGFVCVVYIRKGGTCFVLRQQEGSRRMAWLEASASERFEII